MARGDENDVKDQELQIKIQENERLQREVSATNTLIFSLHSNNLLLMIFLQIIMFWTSSNYPVMNHLENR